VTLLLTGTGIGAGNRPYQLSGTETEITCAEKTGIKTGIEFKPLGIE
jgi:hypothetical protein